MQGSAFLSLNMIEKYPKWSTMSKDGQWGACCASGALLVATLQWKPANMPKLRFATPLLSLMVSCQTEILFHCLEQMSGVSSFQRQQVLQVLTVSVLEVWTFRVFRVHASKKGRSAERRWCPQGGFITTSSTPSIRAWLRLQDSDTKTSNISGHSDRNKKRKKRRSLSKRRF